MECKWCLPSSDYPHSYSIARYFVHSKFGKKVNKEYIDLFKISNTSYM